jgi:hypothetical protein
MYTSIEQQEYETLKKTLEVNEWNLQIG